MKKIFCILLTILLSGLFFACAGEPASTQAATNSLETKQPVQKQENVAHFGISYDEWDQVFRDNFDILSGLEKSNVDILYKDGFVSSQEKGNIIYKGSRFTNKGDLLNIITIECGEDGYIQRVNIVPDLHNYAQMAKQAIDDTSSSTLDERMFLAMIFGTYFSLAAEVIAPIDDINLDNGIRTVTDTLTSNLTDLIDTQNGVGGKPIIKNGIKYFLSEETFAITIEPSAEKDTPISSKPTNNTSPSATPTADANAAPATVLKE